MLRVLFDTNIYGDLLNESDAGEIEDRIAKEKEFIVYDYRPIRKEIRDIPTTTPLSKRTRGLLLSMYDRITGNHHLKDSEIILKLAQEYYEQYRKLGGIHGWHTSIRIDFMIVACASIQGLDIVYSNDNKTLLSSYALAAYDHINMKSNWRTPKFLKYVNLLKKFRSLL